MTNNIKFSPSFIYFIVVLLVATSCAASEELTPTVTLSVITTLLNTSPFEEQSACESANCWAGIVPGSTSLAEAQALLETQYGAPTFGMGEHFFSWHTSVNAEPLGGLIVATTSNIVNVIIVNFSEHQVIVAELIDWIGEPSFVNITRPISSDFLYSSALVSYPNIDINASLYPQDSSSVGISSTQSVSSLIFFTIDHVENSVQIDTFIFEWQGYTDYCELADTVPIP